MDLRSPSAGAHRAKQFGAGRIFLILLAAWALAMIVPAFQRIFDQLGSFGLTLDNDGVITDVVSPFASAAKSPAAMAGIARGDRLDLRAMRCIPLRTPQCYSLVAVLGGAGGMQAVLPDRQITLTLDPISGRPPRIVTIRALPSPLRRLERVVLLADTLVGIAVIALAFWLVWTRPSWMTWGLFLYVIWFNPGQSLAYYAILQRWPTAIFVQEAAESLAVGSAFVGLTIFALRFPHDRTEPRWRPLERALPWLGVAITLLTALSFANMLGFPTRKIAEAGFLAGYAIDAAVLAILLRRRRTLAPQDEQRMRWVIWGCVIGLPVFILAEICQSADLGHRAWGFLSSQAFVGLLYLPNGVLAYFASQAVWQHRVVSVSIPLRRATILTALSVAVGVPVVYLDEKLSQFEDRLHLSWWIWLLFLAPVLSLVVARMHEIAVELADRAFNRKFHSERRQLEGASDTFVRAKTLVEIDCLLVENAVRALRLSSGAIFRSDRGVYRRTQNTKGWDASTKKELCPASDAIALRSLEVGAPVRLSQGAWDAPELPIGIEAPCLCIPVQSGIPEATGVALFGPHETGNDIDADERELLERFALRAAAAYERVIIDLLRQEVAQLRAQRVRGAT